MVSGVEVAAPVPRLSVVESCPVADVEVAVESVEVAVAVDSVDVADVEVSDEAAGFVTLTVRAAFASTLPAASMTLYSTVYVPAAPVSSETVCRRRSAAPLYCEHIVLVGESVYAAYVARTRERHEFFPKTAKARISELLMLTR